MTSSPAISHVNSQDADANSDHHAESIIDSIAPNVAQDLLGVYFSSIHPHWPLIYKPQYYLTGNRPTSGGLPKPLLSAMYCIAACILNRDRGQSDGVRAGTGPPLSSSLLFQTTIRLLSCSTTSETITGWQNLGLLRPSITTCQALTILALQQHGVASFSRSAMLINNAASMAVELRLHRNTTYVDHIQIQVQSRLWWTIYVLEKLMSCEMGRPIFLSADETDTALPSVSESDEYEMYLAKGAEPGKTTLVKLKAISGFLMAIRISKIMESISKKIYSISARSEIRKNRAQGEATRLELWSRLMECNADLVSPSSDANVCHDSADSPVAFANIVVSLPGHTHWPHSHTMTPLIRFYGQLQYY